jgi:hypothetical protein
MVARHIEWERLVRAEREALAAANSGAHGSSPGDPAEPSGQQQGAPAFVSPSLPCQCPCMRFLMHAQRWEEAPCLALQAWELVRQTAQHARFREAYSLPSYDKCWRRLPRCCCCCCCACPSAPSAECDRDSGGRCAMKEAVTGACRCASRSAVLTHSPAVFRAACMQAGGCARRGPAGAVRAGLRDGGDRSGHARARARVRRGRCRAERARRALPPLCPPCPACIINVRCWMGACGARALACREGQGLRHKVHAGG